MRLNEVLGLFAMNAVSMICAGGAVYLWASGIGGAGPWALLVVAVLSIHSFSYTRKTSK